MRIIKKILREPLFYLLILLAALYVVIIPTKMEISDIKVTRDNKTEVIQLPYSVEMGKDEVFLVSLNLSVKNKKNAKFKIVPDDCIQEILINEKQFPLDGINGLCDYSNGRFFDFSKYVQEGLNSFEFKIINSGGPGGLRMETLFNGFYSLNFIQYVFALFLLFSVALILRKFKFKLIAISIILLGIIARLVVYSYTGPMQNPYDIDAHLEYIKIVAEEKRIPKINEGWATYQPPLYYIVSAMVKKIADNYDPSLTNRVQQQFSMLLSFACVIFGVALIINLFGNRAIAYLTALVSVLWPISVMAAPRIGNDSLFYFGALFCMLFAQRYWHFHKNSDMLLATIGASIAVAAKSNGFVILGVWIIVYVLKVLFSLKIGSLRVLLISISIMALSVCLSNYRTIVDIFEKNRVEFIPNAVSLHGGLRVQSTVGNYLYLDLKDYLLFPYTSAWQDEGGRQYFWNYTIKSSLSLYKENGIWKHPVGNFLCSMLCILALLIFILALWGLIHVKYREIPQMLFTVFLFVALIYLRANVPYSCSNEFRYILPVLFPLVYFSTRGVQILANSRLRKLSYISMLVFATLSFVFIVGPAV
ncbi:MAG: hypothetical protein LBC75_09170 [Fibromonadaceae bacterium]|jgi:hypothetical protein|nr:hypothetical protein [Fibromonadaceae bacterium]